MPKPRNPQNLLSLGQRLNDPLLLLEESRLEAWREKLVAGELRLDTALHDATAASSDDDFWESDSAFMRSLRPYHVVDGTLQIPVKGVLLNDFPYAYGSYATGYQYLEAAAVRGVDDFEAGTVKGVALLVDSPGGAVAECFETVAKVSKLFSDAGVPVMAFAACACSAAYVWASIADEVVVGQLSEVGSIGVITTHISYAGMLEKEGIEVTMITSPKGGAKGDGNRYVKLSDGARKRMQAMSDKIYDIFVGHVVEHRGMSDEDVRGTKAQVYLADDAIELGLADRQAVLSDALVEYRQSLKQENAMAGNNTGATTGASDTGSVPKSVHEAALAEAKAEGMKAGATAERARIAAVVNAEAAKDKTASALALALSSGDMTAESAATVLATIPAAVAAPAAPAEKRDNGFTKAMETTQNPDIAPEAKDEKEDENSPTAQSNSLLAAFAKTTGYDPRKKAH